MDPLETKSSQKSNGWENGNSVKALIVAIFLLGGIGSLMGSLLSGSRESGSLTLDSGRAFSLAQAGVAYAGKYLQGVTDWTTLAGSLRKNLGTGNFVVAFSGPTTTDVTATITGNAGLAHRRIVVGFHKTNGQEAVFAPGQKTALENQAVAPGITAGVPSGNRDVMKVRHTAPVRYGPATGFATACVRPSRVIVRVTNWQE